MSSSLNQVTDPIISQLTAKQANLQEILKSIKLTKSSPKEKLRVLSKKNCFQYYIIKESGETNGTYLPRKDIRKASLIAQRDYNKEAVAILKRQLATINKFLTAYHPEELNNAYILLHPGRKTLVTPVREPDEDFIANWLRHPYTHKPFEINAPEYYTTSNIRVRSKSEVIIADALTRANIPYRYEYPTSLKGWGTLYPDFTCLNTTSREEIIWEHFGLMGDPDYTENAIQKISHYAASGYILGKNLIVTFESGNTPLSVKQVQAYIKFFFKQNVSRQQN